MLKFVHLILGDVNVHWKSQPASCKCNPVGLHACLIEPFLPTTCCAGPCRRFYCCNNKKIRVINQQVLDFVKDCYNSGGGRSSRPKGKLIVKREACWRLLYRWVYVALDYSPLHDSRQDRCYRNRSEIGMLCGHSNFGNWTNPGLFPLT